MCLTCLYLCCHCCWLTSVFFVYVFFFKQKTAYEMRISDWSSDVCSSDLEIVLGWLQPRERLIEEDLAARFEVKRHIVREAIFELERIGLVERIPHKGAVVRMLQATEVEIGRAHV